MADGRRQVRGHFTTRHPGITPELLPLVREQLEQVAEEYALREAVFSGAAELDFVCQGWEDTTLRTEWRATVHPTPVVVEVLEESA